MQRLFSSTGASCVSRWVVVQVLGLPVLWTVARGVTWSHCRWSCPLAEAKDTARSEKAILAPETTRIQLRRLPQWRPFHRHTHNIHRPWQRIDHLLRIKVQDRVTKPLKLAVPASISRDTTCMITPVNFHDEL